MDIGLSLPDGLTDIKVCGEFLFITTKFDPNPGKLLVYSTATRNEDGTFVAPEKIQEIEIGYGPDNILTSSDCNIVATANEGEAVYSEVEGLINPPGTVSIIRGPFGDPATPPTRYSRIPPSLASQLHDCA